MASTKFPALKITCFDFHGLAETSRLALYIADVPFEDERISQEDWPKLKPTLPFQQLPVLTVDGQVYSQSHAIERYVGKLTGLYPNSNSLDALRVDEIIDFYDDIFALMMPSFMEHDAEKRKALREGLVQDDKLPCMLRLLEARLTSADSKGEYFLESISLADVVIHNAMCMFNSGFLDYMPTNICDQYARMVQIYEAVKKHPKVVEWYANHGAN